MSLVTRFSVFFLVALAVALGAFSSCLYYLVGLQLRLALDQDLEATLDGFPGSVASQSHIARVRWAIYGEQGQRLESSPDNGHPMILDNRDLAPLSVDVAMTIQSGDGSRWRTLVRPIGGHRRGPRDEHRPRSGKGEDRRGNERGKEVESAEARLGPRASHQGLGPGLGLGLGLSPSPGPPPRDRRPAYLSAWASLEPVEGELRTLAAVLPLISIGLWTLSAFIGQWFGRRSLAPLARMAEVARTMPWADGKARLPSPETRDELEDFAGSFNGLLDRLDEALERQKQFTGQASHQLRTPLAALIATIDVTRRRARTALEHDRVLDQLHSNALRLWRIVEALLFLARADAEAGMPDLELVDLSVWVIDHLQGWSTHERASDLHGPAPSGQLVPVRAHSALLGQLLDNLLENACKYSPAGTPIHVGLRMEAGAVLLTVEDQGHGIPADDLPHVFEPFYRSHQAQLGHAGVGLGLAVVQRIATALGGMMKMYSQSGQGSCFTLHLPLVQPLSQPVTHVTVEPEPVTNLSDTQPRPRISERQSSKLPQVNIQ